MIRELQLETLESRRKVVRLKLFYKIDHRLTPLVIPEQLHLKPIQRRTDNGRAYTHFSCYSDPFFSSFYPRTVREWNSLSSQTVSLACIARFSQCVIEQNTIAAA